MTLLFSSPSVVDVEFRQALLEEQGIACTVRNLLLSGTSNEGRYTFAVPELWAINDADVALAHIVLSPDAANASDAASWGCPSCGEDCEAQFTSCWNCGVDRPVKCAPK
jgi:hypothetical protein